MPKICKVGAQYSCELSEALLCVWQVQEMTGSFLLWLLNIIEKLHFVILINKTSCFWYPYFFFSVSMRALVPHNRNHLILGVDLNCDVKLALSL